MLKPPKGYIEESDPRVAPFGHPAPGWLWPYADLMTELVAFFVILYALSAALNKDVNQAHTEIEQMMEAEGMAGSVELTREGMRITLEEHGDAGYFESGFAELTPKMMDVIDKMAPKLRGLVTKGFPLVIEGHTDNIPIHNDYFWGNWELSTARAVSVVEVLTEQKRFPPECLGAIGYGEHQPIAPNDSSTNRQRNRRVVFFIKTTPFTKDKQCRDQTKTAAEPRAGPAEGAT